MSKNINLYKQTVDGLIQSSAIEDLEITDDDYLELLKPTIVIHLSSCDL